MIKLKISPFAILVTTTVFLAPPAAASCTGLPGCNPDWPAASLSEYDIALSCANSSCEDIFKPKPSPKPPIGGPVDDDASMVLTELGIAAVTMAGVTGIASGSIALTPVRGNPLCLDLEGNIVTCSPDDGPMPWSYYPTWSNSELSEHEINVVAMGSEMVDLAKMAGIKHWNVTSSPDLMAVTVNGEVGMMAALDNADPDRRCWCGNDPICYPNWNPGLSKLLAELGIDGAAMARIETWNGIGSPDITTAAMKAVLDVGSGSRSPWNIEMENFAAMAWWNDMAGAPKAAKTLDWVTSTMTPARLMSSAGYR